MKRLCAAAAVLSFSITAVDAFADSTDSTYRTEFSFVHSSLRDDAQTRSTRTEAAAALYFAALPLNPGYPLAETAFVERAGEIEVAYARGSYEDSDLERNDGIRDASVAIRLAQKDLPLTAFLGLRKIDFGAAKIRGIPAQLDAERKISEVALGYFVQPQLHVSVGRQLSTTSNTLQPAFATIPDFDVETLSVAGRYLGESDGAHFSLFGSAASIDKDHGRLRNREFEVGGRNYLDKNQHIGLRVGLNMGDDRSDQGQSAGVSYGKFLAPTFEVFASYEKFFAADRFEGADADAGMLGAALRF
jgi:hypothetical protein